MPVQPAGEIEFGRRHHSQCEHRGEPSQGAIRRDAGMASPDRFDALSAQPLEAHPLRADQGNRCDCALLNANSPAGTPRSKLANWV